MKLLRLGVFLGLMITTFLLNGCDFKEIDAFSTVLAIGIDQNKDGNILLSMEIANFSKSKSKQQKTLVVSGTGQSIEEAEKNIQLTSPLELYKAHNALILLGSSYAHHNINEVIDYFQRNPDFRPSMFIAVCHETAKDVLKAKVSTESINAFGIREMIDEANKRSLTTSSEMIRWLKDLHHHSHTFRLAALKLDVDSKPEVSGEGLFQHNRLVRWISTKKSPYLLLLTENRISEQLIPIAYTNHTQLMFRILWASVTPRVTMKNGQLFVLYQAKGEGEIAGVSHTMSFTPLKIKMIERKLNEVMSYKTNQVIRSLQKARIDGVDVADVLFRKYPLLYQKYQDNWDEEFSKSVISCEFTIRIIRTGLLV